MRQHLLLISGGILGSLVLAGCGLTGNVNATPAGNGTVHISGTVQTSGVSTSPSPSNTTPTSNASGGSSTSTSSSTGTSPSSTASSLSSSNNELSSFNPVVLQALQAIQGHTTVSIGGPTILPTAHQGYLTAQTHASANSWRVQLVETSQPYAINSPLINGNHVIGGTAAWGATILSSTPTHAAQALEAANGQWTTQTAINSSAPHQSTQVGTAQYGRPATLYPATGNQWSNTKLVFTEGEWTVELIGSNTASEEQAAYTIANTLHFQSLPPYPGLMIVDMTTPASSHAVSLAASVTTLDWVKGATVSWVSASRASSNNPEQAIQLATSWTLWNK